MLRPIKQFKKCDYEGVYNLLKGEKEAILKALIKTNANIEEAYNLLCPQGKPYYSPELLNLRIQQHNISLKAMAYRGIFNSKELKGYKRIKRSKETEVVRERLRRIAEINNTKLRSIGYGGKQE